MPLLHYQGWLAVTHLPVSVCPPVSPGCKSNHGTQTQTQTNPHPDQAGHHNPKPRSAVAEGAWFTVSCDSSPGLTKSWFCDRQHAAGCVSSQRRSRVESVVAAVLLGAACKLTSSPQGTVRKPSHQLHAATWSGCTHLIKQVIHGHRQVVQDHVDAVVLVDLALEVLCPCITFVVVLSDGAGIFHWCCATALSQHAAFLLATRVRAQKA